MIFLAVRNPWQKKTAHAPRYDRPKANPLAKFSVPPGALTVINNFRAKLQSQGEVPESGMIPARYANDLESMIAPFVDVPGLGELKDEDSVRQYRRRARENDMLTVDEARSIVDHSVDYVTSIPVEERSLQIRDPSELRNEYLEDRGEVYEALADDAVLTPYLVNVTWYFEEVRKPTGGRRSPRVKYSVEGTFYATSREDAIAVGQQFINNYIRPAVVGPGSQVIDLSEEGPEGKADAHMAIGSQAIEGPAITKRQAEGMDFDPNFRAFFTRRSGKTSDDQNFRDPYYKCRIVKGRYVI